MANTITLYSLKALYFPTKGSSRKICIIYQLMRREQIGKLINGLPICSLPTTFYGEVVGRHKFFVNTRLLPSYVATRLIALLRLVHMI